MPNGSSEEREECEKQKARENRMKSIDSVGVVALGSAEELEYCGGNPLTQYGNDLMAAGGATASVGTLVSMSGVGVPAGAAAVIEGSATAAAGAGLYAFGRLFGWVNPGYYE